MGFLIRKMKYCYITRDNDENVVQPGKREDVSLLSEWLCHATQRNGVEDSDGHFKDVETAFVLHSIAFLEVVRQVFEEPFTTDLRCR